MAVEFRSNLDVILFILSPPNELPEPITAWNTRWKTSDRGFCSNVIFADAVVPWRHLDFPYIRLTPD